MDDQTWKKTSKLHLVPFQSVSLLHAAALMLQAGTFRCSNGETYRQKVIVQWILATLELVTAARRPDTSFFSQWLNITDNSRKSVHLLTYLWLALCRRELCGDEPRTYSAILTPRGFASDVCDVSSTPLPAEKLPGLLTDVATAHNKQSLKATPHRPRLIGHASSATHWMHSRMGDWIHTPELCQEIYSQENKQGSMLSPAISEWQQNICYKSSTLLICC